MKINEGITGMVEIFHDFSRSFIKIICSPFDSEALQEALGLGSFSRLDQKCLKVFFNFPNLI